MFISDSYKFCFVHIPKTGGTSIKKALYPYANKDQIYFNGEKVTDGPGFHPHEKMDYSSYLEYEKYFKFTIVRNPWERHASLWRFLRSRKDPYIGNIDFDAYIYKVCYSRFTYAANQIDYMGPGHKILVDYIGRFEKLPLAFDYICDRLGLDRPPLPHFKRQEGYDYREMYNKKTIEMIQKHCHPDIVEFDYSYGR